MMTEGGAAVFVTKDVTGGSDVSLVLSSINMIGEDPDPESDANKCDFLLESSRRKVTRFVRTGKNLLDIDTKRKLLLLEESVTVWSPNSN